MITFLWPLVFILLPLPFLARRFLKPVDPGLSGALKVPFLMPKGALFSDRRNAAFRLCPLNCKVPSCRPPKATA